MQAYMVWWILAAVLVGVELTSGTFYLLVYGVAAAVAGVAAWLGAGMVVQLLTAAVIAVARHAGPAPLEAQHGASRKYRGGYGYRPAGADRFLAGRPWPGQISRCAVGCRGRIGQRRQHAAADHSCSQRQYAGSRQLIT